MCDRQSNVRRELFNEEQTTPMAIKLNLQNQQILHLENVAPSLNHIQIIQMETFFPA